MGRTRTKNLSQSAIFGASPHAVYEAIVDPKEHARFSGAAARLERKAGGKFSHYDGSLSGVVVLLEKDRRVVLAWRSSGWPDGHYSIADFRFTKVKGGTRLDFAQYGIPQSDFNDIRDGWRQYYWEPLKVYLEG